nr:MULTISPECIES: 2-oxo acid dehydrogenase subunit E2 [Amycolatopsis]
MRRLAREHGIDLAGITGSGPRGRIVRFDIEDRYRSRRTRRRRRRRPPRRGDPSCRQRHRAPLRAHPGIDASYSPEGRGETVLHEGIHVGIAVSSPSGLVVPVVRVADRSPVTVTVSSLGMFGVDQFPAIINPRQGAILAFGAALGEPWRMRYTITADHRIIDGALAAQFLATLTGLLEHPLRVIE